MKSDNQFHGYKPRRTVEREVRNSKMTEKEYKLRRIRNTQIMAVLLNNAIPRLAEHAESRSVPVELYGSRWLKTTRLSRGWIIDSHMHHQGLGEPSPSQAQNYKPWGVLTVITADHLVASDVVFVDRGIRVVQADNPSPITPDGLRIQGMGGPDLNDYMLNPEKTNWQVYAASISLIFKSVGLDLGY